MRLSIVLITLNEEANLARTLASLAILRERVEAELIVIDSGSTDRTREVAESFGARVIREPWRGFGAQKNFALEQATGHWVLSLDADEELEPELAAGIANVATAGALSEADAPAAYYLRRKNHFLGRWMRHGGYWPDPKLRLFRRGVNHEARFEDRAVHESLRVSGRTAILTPGAILHHCYPTLSDYIEHMNRYSTLGAEMARTAGRPARVRDLVLRPLATFFYNYVVRLGFLDGREGFLQHASHAIYVGWKYAKLWEKQQAGR